ncbi:Os05g0234000 [Oryza sativa Japonica Group]|uniref:Os05g0234000 protein n=1 Tax=Oryza sativa subsp. japonica TaxID=39947 RepID=A0A0P0WJY8_ORYSJ|nr:Os05g0234000 [Oryza sativa Japonica Group]
MKGELVSYLRCLASSVELWSRGAVEVVSGKAWRLEAASAGRRTAVCWAPVRGRGVRPAALRSAASRTRVAGAGGRRAEMRAAGGRRPAAGGGGGATGCGQGLRQRAG